MRPQAAAGRDAVHSRGYGDGGADFLSGIELAEPESEPEAETEEIEEEPEGSKALTLMFAHAIDEGRTGLLEAARQAAQEKGYTLSTVVSLGDPKLQSRFLQLARDAGEQAILLELADPATAAAVPSAYTSINTIPYPRKRMTK